MTAVYADPIAFRQACRNQQWTEQTSQIAPGYVQANLVIVPKAYAYDFLVYCQRNPKPCPVLEVLDVGNPISQYLAKGADIRTDLPQYCIYEKGQLVAEPYDLLGDWRDDFVSFLIGCSFSFENALTKVGINLPHLTHNTHPAVYQSLWKTTPAGPFYGPMAVSMRPIYQEQVKQAIAITARYYRNHGAPIHIGHAAEIIKDISQPEYGGYYQIQPGQVPVFWACGVTPQLAALQAKLPLMITHKVARMFVSDWQDKDFLDIN